MRSKGLRLILFVLALMLLPVSAAYAAEQDDGTESGQGEPVYRLTSPALAEMQGYHDWDAAIVYDLGWDGRPVDGAWLREHVHPADSEQTEMILLSSEYVSMRAQGETAEEDLPVVPDDTVIGTGMCVLFRDPLAGTETASLIIVRGDIVGSGKFSLTQVVALSRMMLDPDQYQYYQITAGDWTGNGRIDLTDLVYESRMLTVSSAEPISASDFVLRSCFDRRVMEYDGNVLALMEANNLWSCYFWWNPATDSGSAENVLTTARGVQLGMSLSEVQQAYGFGYRERFDPQGSGFLNNFAGDDKARTFLAENAAWWLDYLAPDGQLCIEFALDANEKLIFADFLDLRPDPEGARTVLAMPASTP